MKSAHVTNSHILSNDILTSIDSMGGVFNLEETALKLNITTEQVNRDIKDGKLIAFEQDGELRIPSFQIKNFRKMDNLEKVLFNMKGKTFENKIDFLTRPQKMLSDRTPFYILRKKTSQKEIDKVIELSK